MSASANEDKKIRNIAIIAHVDHGKTTLVDGILKQSKVFAEHKAMGELIMDSMDQEKERGITITSKNASVHYGDYKINIVDTPGHADFGGEVERALRMVDGVCLLVDAKEGPMPQTKFVLRKALELGHRAIVIVNKIDKPGADIDAALNKTFDLFVELKANDHQLDFPVVYASGIQGRAGLDRNSELAPDLKPLFETIINQIPSPTGSATEPFQLLVINLGYDNYKGQIVIGRIANGSIKPGQQIMRITPEGKQIPGKISDVLGYDGLCRVPMIDGASAGDIVGLTGLAEIQIGDTIAQFENPIPLPPLLVDLPTLQMTFGVNTSPFSGKEGKYFTSRNLKERLEKELLTNVSLKVLPGESADQFLVSGRGELHLSVLVEAMRREGFELQLGKPEVVLKKEGDKTLEPYEYLFIDVPTEHAGVVMEMIGKRRGLVTKLELSPSGNEQHLEFKIPTSGLIGLRSKLITKTKGTVIMHNLFADYEPYEGAMEEADPHGSLISMENGQTASYGLQNIQERGTLFVGPGENVYAGQVIGENSRADDLEVNPCKGKKLTNMRTSSADESIQLTPPKLMSLEAAIDYIGRDELVEVTPVSIRIRKKYLDPVERKRNSRG